MDKVIQSDQGLKYVYVIDKDNKAQYVRVNTGALQEDGLRVVEGVPKDKLTKDSWVAVGALQMIRARMEIQPHRVEMPSLKSSLETETGQPAKANANSGGANAKASGEGANPGSPSEPSSPRGSNPRSESK